ncbi:MAG: hypothetical protein WDN06_19980 [Asticcacaulis sp.]
MTLDDAKAQEKLTPEERRGLLRAFADRMLLKAAAMGTIPEGHAGRRTRRARHGRHRTGLQPLRPRRGPRPRSAQS